MGLPSNIDAPVTDAKHTAEDSINWQYFAEDRGAQEIKRQLRWTHWDQYWVKIGWIELQTPRGDYNSISHSEKVHFELNKYDLIIFV